ncbi:MAG: family 78 glycoside hydrolase catalytic domain [Planctomycetes bacterium]|nr:family 78 glycoside hydrolase catalytic domain [Planctomycetota bacterium]
MNGIVLGFALALLGALVSPLVAQGEESAGVLEAYALRCEALTEPLGVDVAAPRLSWKLRSTARDQVQTAWRVVVATDAAMAQRGDGDLWDSRRVPGDAFRVRYAGRPLRSHQRCFVSVQVWDAQGRASPLSAPADFTVGVLEPSFWDSAAWIGYDAERGPTDDVIAMAGARWIGHAADGSAAQPLDAPAGTRTYLRRFELPAPLSLDGAELVVLADNVATCSLNGTPVFNEREGWQTATPFDVEHLLRAGGNELRIAVRNTSAGPSGLCARLTMRAVDGAEQAVVTDARWLSSGAQGAEPAPVRELGDYGMAPWGTARRVALRLPPVPHLRTRFEVGAGLRRALLYGTALGTVDFEVNGQRVSDERFTPGWTDYRVRVPYRCWDVTGRLRDGSNTLTGVLADGWFSGYIGWGRRRDHFGTKSRLRCVLRLEYADGRVAEVRSGPDWTARCGPIREADFLMGERYDARVSPDAPDAEWSPVATGAELAPVIEWHPGPPVVAFAELAPVARTEPTPGAWVFDLGQNFAGVARLRVEAPSGTVVTLRFAERLNPDGTIYTTNLRGARATDTYVCRGGGVEVWEPRFTFHGFQYVEVSGLPGVPRDDAITGIAVGSDTPKVGSFECSDPMLNRLASNAYWTQRANFIEVPTDCPQRDERLGWTGDAQAYVATAALNCDVEAFFTKWLRDLTDAQRADGQFPMVAPRIVAGDDGGPGWADAGVIVPWQIWLAYGDRELLARQYPSMLRFVDFCERRSRDGVLPPDEFHCFGDWLSIDAPTPKQVIYSAYHAQSVDLTARVAALLGDDTNAARLTALCDRVRAAFRSAYVDADGRIDGDTQCDYVLALTAGIDDARFPARLVELIAARDFHLSTGFLGTKDLMWVLTAIGRDDVAFRLLMNDTFPSWGFTIRHGATSIWERWDGWTPERGFQDPGMNSFAHYAFGAVHGWVVANVGGIRPAGPGCGLVAVQPRPGGGVTFARTRYDGPRGPIAVDWRLDGDRLRMTVEIPPGVRPVLDLPPDFRRDVRIDGVPAATEPQLGSGRYEVTALRSN